jgi:hypothetical protein
VLNAALHKALRAVKRSLTKPPLPYVGAPPLKVLAPVDTEHRPGLFLHQRNHPITAAVLSTGAMRTSDEYRAMADQCLSWAREAPNTDARDCCYVLARVWMKEAIREDLAAKGMPSAATLGCNGPPFLGDLNNVLKYRR